METTLSQIDAEDFNRAKARIFDVSISSSSVEEVVEAAARELDNPLLAIDSAMQLLGYWPHERMDDSDWNYVLDSGHVERRFAAILTHQTQQSRLSQDGKLMYYEATDDQASKYRCTVTSGSIPVAGLMLLETNHAFGPRDEALIMVAAQAVANVMQKSLLFERPDDNPMTTVFEHILQDRDPGPERIREVLLSQGLPDNAPYFAFYLSFSDHQRKFLPYWERCFDQHPGIHVGSHGNSLVGIAFCGDSAAEMLEAVASIAKRTGLDMGVSAPADDLGRARHAVRMAHEALDTGRASKTLAERRPSETFLYEDLALGTLFADRRFLDALEEHPDPRVERLAAHDSACNGKLCEAMLAYLESGCNLSLAARRSFMHRNTLVYQVERAVEVSKADMDDPDARLSMLLALKLAAR